MRYVSVATLAIVFAIAPAQGLRAQVARSPSVVPVPRLVSVTGVYQPADGQPPPAGTVVTLLMYADEQGGTPLWQETQNVVLDKSGRYSLLLGAGQADGIPLEVFTSGEAQWLALHFAGLGEVEGPRTRIASVPYALRSADADTLGGHPASEYLLAPTSTTADGHPANAATSTATGTAQSSTASSTASPNVVLPGTPNVLAKYVNGADVGNSAIFESGGLVGINTTTPADVLHVRFTNTGGSMTGLAVQNLGNTATSYSGTLFYDQNGALGQFQGFNNVTHEYRINNIAKNGASAFDGSINFMTGSTSRFLVTSAGNVGIGTTAPSALFDVSNALVPTTSANINVTSFGAQSGVQLRRARGTAGAPSALQAGDPIGSFTARGYGATGFSPSSTGMSVMAAENWTDTAQGTFINIFTTPNGSNQGNVRMTLAPDGSLGIGTVLPNIFNAGLEVSNAQTNTTQFATTMTSSFTGSNAAGSLFVGRKARGSGGAPAAVQAGDNLAGFAGRGYGATGFGVVGGGMFVRAAENWTDIAQGTSLNFNTTATGTNTAANRMIIDPSGNVGIGTVIPSGALDVVRTGDTNVFVTSVQPLGGPQIATRVAHGTQGVPTAVQAGDLLGFLGAGGHDGTNYTDGRAGFAGIAAENWTSTAQGTTLVFGATPIGSNNTLGLMSILPSGFVGIGTPKAADGTNTAADRLQVFGDVRVGTTGTNGCIKNFAGTGIAGTCSSDRRLKRDITPFGSTLNQLTALQPVHFSWRAAEFPDRHFGEAQAYGLIAQDVERIFPELVVTGEDGFKAIDYSKLPLLTIQAVKELKAENDDLKAQNNALKDRVTEIERLIKEMRPTSQR